MSVVKVGPGSAWDLLTGLGNRRSYGVLMHREAGNTSMQPQHETCVLGLVDICMLTVLVN